MIFGKKGFLGTDDVLQRKLLCNDWFDLSFLDQTDQFEKSLS